VRYSLHREQHRRWIGIYRNPRGVVGGEITYTEPRAEAERIISDARSGRDPFLSDALLRRADISSFEGLCARFLADPNPGRRGRAFSQATRDGLTRIVRKELVRSGDAAIRTQSSARKSSSGPRGSRQGRDARSRRPISPIE
jgi:hypothetical protein